MVALVRRLTGIKRVGHAGTLDPLASGVLPVAFGQATRLIEYMDDESKEYEAVLRLGVETDTYDAEGAIVAEQGTSDVTAGALEAALASFTGDIEQAPPLYSAIKLAGKPLYRYAREGTGAEVELRPRRVCIDAIDLLGFERPEASIRVRCGKGTYIRSLAHDVGAALGCGAHLAALRRTRSGGFGASDAHAPEALRVAAGEDRLDELALAPDRAVERRPAAILAAASASDVALGRDVLFEAAGDASICRAYSASGAFLGMVARRAERRWHPEKVLDAS
jgi:tRNA pseudouridine55 synthase